MQFSWSFVDNLQHNLTGLRHLAPTSRDLYSEGGLSRWLALIHAGPVENASWTICKGPTKRTEVQESMLASKFSLGNFWRFREHMRILWPSKTWASTLCACQPQGGFGSLGELTVGWWLSWLEHHQVVQIANAHWVPAPESVVLL